MLLTWYNKYTKVTQVQISVQVNLLHGILLSLMPHVSVYLRCQ